MQRSYSDKFLPGQSDYDLVKNKNVEWLNHPYVLTTYVLLTLLVWFVLHVMQIFSLGECWTATNIVHGAVRHDMFNE
jgi:hypothetical protein